MLTGGVDVGVNSIKLVILDGDSVLGSRVLRTSSRVGRTLANALRGMLSRLSLDEVDNFGATGVGRKKVSFARELVPEIVADARGVVWRYPSARTIIDIGAEEARVIKCDQSGSVLYYARNNRCAAGAGAFMESMARALEVSLEELGDLALCSSSSVQISSTCAVFAESEVVSLMHSNIAKADIARAISESIAVRTSSLVAEVGAEKDIVFIGGAARNRGILDELRRIIGCDILVPEDPQIMGALGAALIARDGESR